MGKERVQRYTIEKKDKVTEAGPACSAQMAENLADLFAKTFKWNPERKGPITELLKGLSIERIIQVYKPLFNNDPAGRLCFHRILLGSSSGFCKDNNPHWVGRTRDKELRSRKSGVIVGTGRYRKP